MNFYICKTYNVSIVNPILVSICKVVFDPCFWAAILFRYMMNTKEDKPGQYAIYSPRIT